jgi:alpha-tubulin suppressor-like RCC1 family protein
MTLPACRRGPAPLPQHCSATAACPGDSFCSSGRCISAVVSIAAGAEHTCALHKDGHVSCWGDSDAVKARGRSISGPVAVALEQPTALAAAARQTCAVVKGGHVRCFGSEDFTVRDEGGKPLDDVKAVALGTGFGCAANPAGVHCWGRNEYGQLGRPLGVSGSSNAVLSRPGAARLLGAGLAVVALTAADKPELCAWGNNATRVIANDEKRGAIPAPACRPADNVVDLTVGTGHACVRYARGTFACWGERYYGQLGVASTETSDVEPPGLETSLPTAVRQIVAGAGHTCALAEDGRVFCFGLNNVGQVSEDAAAEQIRSPYERRSLAGRVLALGTGPMARHTCAVLKDGAVECWGSNHRGQLGDAPAAAEDARFSRTSVRVAF